MGISVSDGNVRCGIGCNKSIPKGEKHFTISTSTRWGTRTRRLCKRCFGNINKELNSSNIKEMIENF